MHSRPSGSYILNNVDVDLLRKLNDNRISKEVISYAIESFKRNKLLKMADLAVNLLRCNFGDPSNTSQTDFVRGCSFFLNVSKVAEYGRESKFAFAPRSLPPKEDGYGNLPSCVKDMFLSFHNKALEKGFHPCTSSNFY